MVLKANDRRTSSPCHDEFRGPRSDCVRQKESSISACQCLLKRVGDSGDHKHLFYLKVIHSRLKNKTSHVTLYLQKTLIAPVPFWIADIGCRMGERNARCDHTPGWGEYYEWKMCKVMKFHD
ncbi:hypothetical protein TNCV_2061041 [Trichonephila clavipes]|nr:hypothetical protein TNCV_2061041 [Trichonephila clavipes]